MLAEMDKLSAQIEPDEMTEFDYYPLAGTGERFPVSDKNLISKTTPRPVADHLFLQGLYEGIARIEHRGYDLLMRIRRKFSVRPNLHSRVRK